MKIGQRWPEAEMPKWQVIFDQALSSGFIGLLKMPQTKQLNDLYELYVKSQVLPSHRMVGV